MVSGAMSEPPGHGRKRLTYSSQSIHDETIAVGFARKARLLYEG